MQLLYVFLSLQSCDTVHKAQEEIAPIRVVSALAYLKVTQEDSEASQKRDCRTGSVAQPKIADERGFSCIKTLLRVQCGGEQKRRDQQTVQYRGRPKAAEPQPIVLCAPVSRDGCKSCIPHHVECQVARRNVVVKRRTQQTLRDAEVPEIASGLEPRRIEKESYTHIHKLFVII